MNVSIIIPTYNRGEFIGQAIQSVIDQTYSDWELIVVDDASTDDTESIVADFIKNDEKNRKNGRIKYIRQEKNIGISRNRNSGIEKAVGTYIAMLDSDDVWLDREKLARQVAFLEKNRDYALVGTWVRTIDKTGSVVGDMTFAQDDGHIRQRMLCRNQFVQSSVLFVKKAAVESGLYDPKLIVNEDYDLWLRLGISYKFANLPHFTTGYRVHAGSIIREKKLLAAHGHFDIIKKYRRDYPRFGIALIKAYLRIVRAYFF
jgi:glycosyltransferase involved in cell wall biosynthesis